MPIVDLDETTRDFADDIQCAMFSVMYRHADCVSFSDQVGIMGMVLGSLLRNLPSETCEAFITILEQNVRLARGQSEPMRLQ